MFNNALLIQISGLSPATFYRRLKKCGAAEEKPSGYMDDITAALIAKQMGFAASFEKYIEKNTDKILKKQK